MSPLPINSAQHNHSGILRDNFNETVNWDTMDDSVLEEQYFSAFKELNALGQILTSTSPDGSVHRPTMNHSGQLKKVEIQLKGENAFKPFVSNIDYNEKGQRASMSYGNGTKTTYEYDAFNYALKRLRTSRSQNADLLQDLHYVYDPVGNTSWIKDHAQQTIYFENHQVDPINAYTYDSFYQLKSATGREHASKNDFGSVMSQVADLPQILSHKADGTKMQSYTREYSYDKVGNMLSSKHTSTVGPSFNRQFKYSSTNNSLSKSGIGKDDTKWQKYTYDDAWNTEKLAHLDSINWNYKNELQELKRSDIQASYQYDSGGERGRKIVQKGNKKVEVRYYLGSVEIYREYEQGKEQPTLERESLHVMDDLQRICVVDTKTVNENGVLSGIKTHHLSRYQLGNHLGSASVELDDKAKMISYEEYYPYGNSSFQSVDKTREVPRKRYRYTGMERDEESGLNYHSARYYAPWLCRWLKPDPAGTVDGLNVWRYVRGNPVNLIDPNGKNPLMLFWRGEGVGVPPISGSATGGHDLGDGQYWSSDPDVAKKYAAERALQNNTSGLVKQGAIDPTDLKILDLTKDKRWLDLAESVPDIAFKSENYARLFEGFIQQHKIDVTKYDVIVGWEKRNGGLQYNFRSKKAIEELKKATTVIENIPLKRAKEIFLAVKTAVRTTSVVKKASTAVKPIVSGVKLTGRGASLVLKGAVPALWVLDSVFLAAALDDYEDALKAKDLDKANAALTDMFLTNPFFFYAFATLDQDPRMARMVTDYYNDLHGHPLGAHLEFEGVMDEQTMIDHGSRDYYYGNDTSP